MAKSCSDLHLDNMTNAILLSKCLPLGGVRSTIIGDISLPCALCDVTQLLDIKGNCVRWIVQLTYFPFNRLPNSNVISTWEIGTTPVGRFDKVNFAFSNLTKTHFGNCFEQISVIRYLLNLTNNPLSVQFNRYARNWSNPWYRTVMGYGF